MGLTGALAAVKVAQQDAEFHIHLRRNRQVDGMTVARGHVDLLALAILQLLQLEADIALGCHQLQAVAEHELVLHLDLDQPFGIAAMVFNWVPAVAAVLIAAVLMVLCGCLRNVEEAYRTINWESIVLIAAMLPMSVALEKTGASEAISHGLVAGLGGFGPFALMAGVYFTASLLTMFISNTATAVLLAPIALQSSASMGISPYPLLLAVSVGTSMCFASPFSTPPNALVMPAGKYTFMDYVKVGVPLQVIMGLVMVVVIP